MKRWFRKHSVRIYQIIFIFCCFFTLVIIGRGFFSVFKNEIMDSIDGWASSVAEKICEHIYKEESSVFFIAEQNVKDEYLIVSLLSGVELSNIDLDNSYDDTEMLFTKIKKDTNSVSSNVFDLEDEEVIEVIHITEDETTDELLHSLEQLALLENNNATKTDTSAEEEDGILNVEKMESMIPEKVIDYSGYGSEGDIYDDAVPAISISNLLKTEYSLEKMKNLNYLLANYYIVDTSTKATASLFQVENLLNKDMTIDKNENSAEPQILIYHTHASESYVDSREGVLEDTVAGPGEYLAELLRSKGYSVYHDKTAYDKKNGMDNRNYAYSTARPNIEKFLEENPSVLVVIDLHRDSGAKRVTMVNGKPTAQIMFFNGLCRNANGPITDLENPYITDNLSFSLQTNLIGRTMYPGFMYKIYLKNYRYNQHLAERYLLIELGTNLNTVEEAYNAMGPLANVLDQVLTNK